MASKEELKAKLKKRDLLSKIAAKRQAQGLDPENLARQPSPPHVSTTPFGEPGEAVTAGIQRGATSGYGESEEFTKRYEELQKSYPGLTLLSELGSGVSRDVAITAGVTLATGETATPTTAPLWLSRGQKIWQGLKNLGKTSAAGSAIGAFESFGREQDVVEGALYGLGGGAFAHGLKSVFQFVGRGGHKTMYVATRDAVDLPQDI